MRVRIKILLGLGVMCLSAGMLAGGAVAKGGNSGSGHGGDKKAKLGKASKIGKSLLKVEVRGSIVSLGADEIVLSAGPGLPPQTCAIPPGSDLSRFGATDRVRAECRSANGELTLVKLRKRDKGDRLTISVRGTATTLNATTVVVDPGSGLPVQTCAVDSRTRIFGAPVQGGQVKVSCKAKNGKALRARTIAEKIPQAKAKGTLAIGTGTVTVAGVTCTVPSGAVLPAAGAFVEIKCAGTPLALKKIELEDDDD